ncbi:DUF6182 family protein [Dactylosporangium sp. NPDC005555]|uniref:DUF6182 family protein n=1 Tax=Dactylosporangium sp. NPDC005555 TaxID=3154889 RepID=UPI0033BBCD64
MAIDQIRPERLARLFTERARWVGHTAPSSPADGPDGITVLVVLRDVDLTDLVNGARSFAAGLDDAEADAWRRSWTRTRFLFGDPANVGQRTPLRFVARSGRMAWLGPFPAGRLPGISRMLRPVTGVLPDLPAIHDVADTPAWRASPGPPRQLHVAVRGLSLADYLVHLHHTVAEAVLRGRLKPGEPLQLVHKMDLDGLAVGKDDAYARVHFGFAGPPSLRLYTLLPAPRRRTPPTGGNVDLPDYSEADLARIALSTHLQRLAETFRQAVAAPDTGGSPGGDTGLAASIWTLLTQDVTALHDTVVSYARSRGCSWEDVAALTGVEAHEARERWQDATGPPVADPAAAASALDAWYVRHGQVEPLARVRDPFTRLLDGRTPDGRQCLVCAKYAGAPVPAWAGLPVPPGGHLIDDGTWRVGHGPTPYWPAGTLLIESRRHFDDYAGFAPAEATTLGPLIQRLTGPLKEATGAPRIHLFASMEGTEHFHLWMLPRVAGMPENRTHVGDPGSCTPAEAERAIDRIRRALRLPGDPGAERVADA